MDTDWRVGNNDYGAEISLDSANMETFKKEPISSFAREIVQNSIDAKQEDKEKVFVEFKTFLLDKNRIPQRTKYIAAFRDVCENWESKPNTRKHDLKRMREMLSLAEKDKILSMRVSDFNTTGLVGINSDDQNSQFYALVKGEGVSFKTGTTGGSKGIGKYASFVVSKLHTVFYNSKTTKDELGYIGRAILPSGIYRNPENGEKDPELKTNGEWYFADTPKKISIAENIMLDPNFIRDQSGTDLYIIGFDAEDKWENEMTIKILESFLVAIVKDELEVTIDDIKINKNTLENIIMNLDLPKSRVAYKIIKSQYDLLTSEDKLHKKIHLENYGIIDLYIKSYSKEQQDEASSRCVIVRYPYMKIKEIRQSINIPFSALAVINNDRINETLRKFENPEHTDWFFKRNDYSKQDREEAETLYKKIEEQIRNAIIEFMKVSNAEQTDFEGASEYLPEQSSGLKKDRWIKEQTKIMKSKPKYRNKSKIEGIIDEDDFDLVIEDELDIEDLRVTVRDNEEKDDEKIEIKGISYNLVVLDKDRGKYLIVFNSEWNFYSCDLILDIAGDSQSSEKHKINIVNAKVNGKMVSTQENKIINFDINNTIENIIEIQTDQTEMFSGKVVIYENR